MEIYHWVILGSSGLCVVITIGVMALVMRQCEIKASILAIISGVLGLLLVQPFFWIYLVDAYRVSVWPSAEPTEFALDLALGLGIGLCLLGALILGAWAFLPWLRSESRKTILVLRIVWGILSPLWFVSMMTALIICHLAWTIYFPQTLSKAINQNGAVASLASSQDLFAYNHWTYWQSGESSLFRYPLGPRESYMTPPKQAKVYWSKDQQVIFVYYSERHIQAYTPKGGLIVEFEQNNSVIPVDKIARTIVMSTVVVPLATTMTLATMNPEYLLVLNQQGQVIEMSDELKKITFLIHQHGLDAEKAKDSEYLVELIHTRIGKAKEIVTEE